jgi:thiol-disulfide isomerase/thioredoxin
LKIPARPQTGIGVRRVAALAVVITALAVAFPLAHAVTGARSDIASASEAGDPIDFALKDLGGKLRRLSDLRGHPVIVDFWATWCGPCRRQIPELESIHRRYQSRGLVVIGVACDTIRGDGVKAIAPFVKEMRIQYPILLADDALVDRLDLDYIPTTLFVGRDGRVVSRVKGAGRKGELAENARALVADSPIPVDSLR